MIVYCKDFFEEKGFVVLIIYINVLVVVEVLYNLLEMFGFVVVIKVDEGFMSQVLEYVFFVNGVILVDENGFLGFDEVKIVEVFEFYKVIVEVFFSGELYWK